MLLTTTTVELSVEKEIILQRKLHATQRKLKRNFSGAKVWVKGKLVKDGRYINLTWWGEKQDKVRERIKRGFMVAVESFANQYGLEINEKWSKEEIDNALIEWKSYG